MLTRKTFFVKFQVIIKPESMSWRQISGHLKKIETCNAGITWGIAFDGTAWVFTELGKGGFEGETDVTINFLLNH